MVSAVILLRVVVIVVVVVLIVNLQQLAKVAVTSGRNSGGRKKVSGHFTFRTPEPDLPYSWNHLLLDAIWNTYLPFRTPPTHSNLKP